MDDSTSPHTASTAAELRSTPAALASDVRLGYAAFYDLVDQERPDLRPVVTWLILGTTLGERVLRTPIPDPTSLDMAALVPLFAKNEALLPMFEDLLHWASAHARHAAAIQILVEADDEVDAKGKTWSSPVQVLARPRPTMAELLEAFKRRQLEGDESAKFLAIGARLEKAAQIDDSARRKRLKGWLGKLEKRDRSK